MKNENIGHYGESGKPKNRNSPSPLQPLLFAGTLLVGLFIGNNMGEGLFSMQDRTLSGSGKLAGVIDIIENNYVDSVQRTQLVDDAIRTILSGLDPHSYYISPEELAAMTEPLEGEFDGIGVEFIIQDDTLRVVKTVPGGPSEKAGIEPGDKIVQVDGQDISGKELTSEQAMKKLKGKRGTEVKVGIKRKRSTQLLEFTLERDAIPISSVSAAIHIDDQTGYIKIERFAKTTYDEFMKAAHKMRDEGMKKLVLDLRGNGGGFMDPATMIIEEFLTSDKLIVYTEGLHSPRMETRSGRDGRFRNMDLVVLIDQGSASASEIVAGALQDWDRSVTVGRRSFGKGLVQHEIDLPDSSALRLTVARYYTPTGRCIQRPYGDSIDYDGDFHDRLVHGEFSVQDSTSMPDSLKFTTPGGRTVFGGGGIMPDVFVPIDSVFFNPLLSEIAYSGILRDFCFNYVDENRKELQAANKSATEFVRSYEISDAITQKFLAQAREDGFEFTDATLNPILDEIKMRIKAQIGKNLFDDNTMHHVLLSGDHDFAKAIEVLSHYSEFAVIKK
jgi:carboxyl-terminal processing protease